MSRFHDWASGLNIDLNLSGNRFTKEFVEHSFDTGYQTAKNDIIKMIDLIQPVGGRMWSSEQLEVFNALQELRRGIESCRF